MSMKIQLPQVGETVTEGIIGRWLKQVGDRVEKYDPLVEVVTDKVNMELPSPQTGVLTAILAQEGDTVLMGATIAEMDVEGATDEQEPPDSETLDRTGVLLHEAYAMGPTGARGPESTAPTKGEGASSQTTQRYSPAVRKLAQEHNVDLSQVLGSGIAGRVTRQDVLDYVKSNEAPVALATNAPARPSAEPVQPIEAGPDEEIVPLTPVRRIIADNMVKSATQIPQAWSVIEVDVTELVQRREAVKEEFQRQEGVLMTYLPFVVKAVAQLLKKHPLLNSAWGGDKIIVKRRINIGIAVAAPQGLTVPVIHDADTKSIADLAKAIADLTTRSRDGKLILPDVQGATFTVNNTGALGSVSSQPLVNPPQAAILTTEVIVKRPVVVNDAIVIRSIMNVCLAFDHRILDGSEVGAFLANVKSRLETIGPETGIY